MSSQRYQRVATIEDGYPDSPVTPQSPPPSFRSRASSLAIRNRTLSTVNQNLAEAFDADGSDIDEDNDGDSRQRLMQGLSSSSPRERRDTAIISPLESSRPTVARSETNIPPQGPTTTTGRVYGGGSGSDGVFANLSAKPESGEKIDEHPPTYEQAAADCAPPYWETTILAPGLGGLDEVYVEGLPVGSVFSFIWNGMISMSFQLVGFLLTYLLHTTHAAKNGSRAGLGITLVQYGFYMKGSGSVTQGPIPDGGPPQYSEPPDPNSHDFDPDQIGNKRIDDVGSKWGNVASSEWMAYILMIVGWFILIRAISDFLKARRHEQLVLRSPDRGLNVPIISSDENSTTVV
ncbi:BgTH12-02667 [Blumeria graminis f. sp. triticale]|uniref:Bgt-4883 n=3 Tax=Blumeria graminis TaxID=34373 RepID=A0A061HP12_BLUGR|nr:Heavy metal ion homeostasis protein [Blumeria graminis f. sp. tritici 96224]CAD6502994.1 BgTH12-02667 [Blumeria graminis f. sp. triticale]VDB88916.1 Bgt-4883 [Blumeria graminis f. sp. tritici]